MLWKFNVQELSMQEEWLATEQQSARDNATDRKHDSWRLP